jgi:hypothetical protein
VEEKEKTWVVTFSDHVKAETEEEAYVQLLEYLAMCVSLRDVTAFGFTEGEMEEKEKTNTVQGNLQVLWDMLGTTSEYDAIRHQLNKIIEQVYEQEGFLVWRVRRIAKLGRHISDIAAELEEMSTEGLGE